MSRLQTQQKNKNEETSKEFELTLCNDERAFDINKYKSKQTDLNFNDLSSIYQESDQSMTKIKSLSRVKLSHVFYKTKYR